MKIDVLAGEPQFIDHTAPVYLALPPEIRGDFIIVKSKYTGLDLPNLIARAARRGVDATSEATDPTRPILVTSYGDMKEARKLGRTQIARMEHGIGQSFVDSTHASYAGGVDAHDVSLFLTPNEHSADRWRRAYPRASVVVVGCPKMETLPHRRSGRLRPTIGVSFHWGLGAPGTDSLPETKGCFGEYRAVLASLARRYPVLGHGHPRMLTHLGRYYSRIGIPVIEDFNDICRQADLYICDTNSTIYEFASTGRPVVVLNARHFRRDVPHGLRFDWGVGTNVGVQVNDPKELLDAVEEALADNPARQAAREKALNLVYRYRTGAAKRAAAALIEWASVRQAVAA